jgi:hypothetical protein
MPVILKNNASSSLAAAITAADTGIVVRNGNLFPALAAGEYFYATLAGVDGSKEIVKVTARSGHGMSVVRAQEDTMALPFPVDSRVELRVTAASITDLVDEHDQASEISIADAGNYYTGTSTEAALQEVGAILATVPVNRGGTGATTADGALVNLSAQKKFAQVRKDVATLLADTTITYTAGTVNTVSTGDVVQTATEGFSYSVAASGATNHHVATAGGVKLYVVNAGKGASVDALGALGNGTSNDSSAFSTAATVGGVWTLRDSANYRVANVALNLNGTGLVCDGICSITKNANGSIFTGSGSDLSFVGISFRGGPTAASGLTGDSLSFTGDRITFTRCGSRWAAGRALKATGGPINIFSPSDIWQTDDSTSTGYDIEIGVSGTATLYHQLHGIRSSQATGGILLVDTGSHTLSGGQFGKLTIRAGTRPGGVNGGMTVGCRILGDVIVEQSTSVFTGNQFSTQTITFTVGTSQHSLDTSNALNSATIVNNGNSNAPIIKSVGTGSPSGVVLQYGPDSFNSTVRYSSDEIYFTDASLFLPNNKALRFIDSAGTSHNGVTLSSGDDWTFGADTGANFTNINSGSVGIFMAVAGTNIYQFYSGGMRPGTDNAVDLGTAAARVRATYSREIRPGDGTPIWTSGTGTPEGAVTAPVGSLFTRTDGGAGTTLYVKQSGTGNTGWVGK